MKPTDLVSRIEAVKTMHENEFAALDRSLAELWHAYVFFEKKRIDPYIAATLAIAAVENILEEE